MKFGVIDIGSNSVRLMINENGKTLYKLVEITALAEGMGVEKICGSVIGFLTADNPYTFDDIRAVNDEALSLRVKSSRTTSLHSCKSATI